ncbi:hypothetical protein [Mesorhizobium sp.]|uniref:hypothetical protein n=1 Tax=Mesorhizobium sp. TaxID=1871066 RepID=UPI0025F0AD67|nr:hypothetical protein [Mesorhizobium sp.]
MEAIFDDITEVLRQPRTDVWGKARAIVLDLAGKLLTGLAIGIGFAIVHAIAG